MAWEVKETRRSLGGDRVVRIEWVDWVRQGQAGRVLVIGRRRNAEHKSDVKKRGFRIPLYFIYAARRLFFPLGHASESPKQPASRPVALVKLWLPQPYLFRVRVTSESEYIFSSESSLVNIRALAHV